MIWLVGARGLLGTDVGLALEAAGLAWVGTGRDVDITDPTAIAAFTQDKTIDWVVNCAAYTSVDQAEGEGEVAQRLNVEGASNLASWARDHQAALVHLSTDYVFSGTATRPYHEDDAVEPRGVYAQTKEASEREVRRLCPRHYIVRTAWLYGAHGANFVTAMVRLMGERDEVGVVADQWGCPTWTVDLASVIVALVRRSGPWGTYHAAGAGLTNRHEFALAIQSEAEARGVVDPLRPVRLVALRSDQYPTRAPRPAWSVLATDRLRTTFGLTLPPWRESLALYFERSYGCIRLETCS